VISRVAACNTRVRAGEEARDIWVNTRPLSGIRGVGSMGVGQGTFTHGCRGAR